MQHNPLLAVSAIQRNADLNAAFGEFRVAVDPVGVMGERRPVQAGAGGQEQPAARVVDPAPDPLRRQAKRGRLQAGLHPGRCLDGLLETREQRQVSGHGQLRCRVGLNQVFKGPLVSGTDADAARFRAVSQIQPGVA